MDESVLNPFQKTVTEGISLITAVKNRIETLEEALKTWITHEQINEIIIVDWDSDESLIPLVQKYQNGKIFLAVVKDQPKWILSYAYNLAARLTTKTKILKTDADIKLFPGFFEHHPLDTGLFYSGNWETARNDNERHLNGTMFIFRADFFNVNGYNEFITSYGWDDSDLYLRIESQGIEHRYLNPDDIYHIEHEKRTTHQDKTSFIQGINDQERTILNIEINRHICNTMPGWSPTYPMLDFKVEFRGSTLYECSALSPASQLVSNHIAEQCERLALIDRLTHFQLFFDKDVLNLFTRDDLKEIYLTYVSDEDKTSAKNLIRVLMKLNNLIHQKNDIHPQYVTEFSPKINNDQSFPKISIVTPNFNGGVFLEETILSVIGQNYPNLEYIVIDGGSNDNSLEIIKKYANYIVYWESNSDKGLYHALQKGFEKSTGEIMGWINSDDILQKKSLFALSDIFSGNPDIHWVQGYPVVIDEMGRIVYHRAHVYSKHFFYLKEYNHDGRFIQQESTFWRRTLWEKAGGYISTQYKYAGDFELWIRFFQHEKLHITNTMLGAFRMRRDGQLSKKHYQDYLAECDLIIDTNAVFLTKIEKKRLQQENRRKYYQERFPRLSKLFFLSRSVLDPENKNRVNFDFNLNEFR